MGRAPTLDAPGYSAARVRIRTAHTPAHARLFSTSHLHAGIDIANGNAKLIVGFVWQLMRLAVLALLKSLGDGEAAIKDADIVAWANAKVEGAKLAARITGFNDASLGARCGDRGWGVESATVGSACVEAL